MANWKRRVKTGTHRVKIPGIGWLTVKPGQPILDQNGEMVDCGPEVFRTQAENYIQVGGMPITIKSEAEKAEAKLPPQAAYVLQRRAKGSFYDVVNQANPEKPVNEKALRKADAEALLEQLLGDKLEPKCFGTKGSNPGVKCGKCPAVDGCVAASIHPELSPSPACFGGYVEGSDNCLRCDFEADCSSGSKEAVLECPYEDEGFGKVFDSFQECDGCAINAQCKAAQEAGE